MYNTFNVVVLFVCVVVVVWGCEGGKPGQVTDVHVRVLAQVSGH